MLKKLFEIIKKVIFSVLVLYGYNLISSPLNLMVPINIVTVSLISILGMPALFALILVLLLVF